MFKLRPHLKGGLLILLAALVTSALALAAMTPKERAEAYYKQGYLYYVEDDFNKAILEYDKALALEPLMAKAHYWKGKCYFALKQYEKAKESLVKAINISPHIDDGPALMKKVEAATEPKAVITTTRPEPTPTPTPPPPEVHC